MNKITTYIIILILLITSVSAASVSHKAEHIMPGVLGDTYTGNWSFMNGNVGIGTSNPTEKLHIENGSLLIRSNAAGNNGLIYFYNTSNNESGQIYGYKSDLKLYSDGNILLTNIGNVGIGTSNPSAKLDVIGTIKADSLILNSSGNVQFELRSSSPTATNYIDFATNATNIATPDFNARISYVGGSTKKLSFYNNDLANPRVTIDSTGNIGIGTSSPRGRLEIHESSNAPALILTNTYGSGGSIQGNTSIDFHHFDDVNPSAKIIVQENGLGNYESNMLFYTRGIASDSSPNERMRIAHNGNVGIGTSNPQYLLDVNGATNFNGTINLDNGNNGKISWTNGYNDGRTRIDYYNNSWVLRKNTGEESIFVKSNGNVGIGTTNPYNKLHVNGQISLSGTQQNPAYIYANSNGDNSKLFIKSGSTSNVFSAIEIAGNWNGSGYYGGKLSFYTAGNERMKIDATGNVGIGTTSPNSKLTVGGNPISAASLGVVGFSSVTAVEIQQNGTANILNLRNNASDAVVVVKNSGNVGIGTTTPDSKLHVVGEKTHEFVPGHKWRELGFSVAALANDATTTVSGYTIGDKDSGEIFIVDRSENQHAKFYFYSTGTVEEQDSHGDFSQTFNGAGTINVYITGGAITVQNKDGAARAIKVYVKGFDE